MKYIAINIPIFFGVVVFSKSHTTANQLLFFWLGMGIIYALVYIGDCMKEAHNDR
jgi:uncharacterized membrane protein SirB2